MYIENRVVFLGVDCKARTDESLFNEEDEEFPKGRSVLLDIPNFGAVTGITIDPMHAISEGVVLTTYLKLIAMHIPKECGRKITSIDTSSRWKATQYRLFLVYVGMVALLLFSRFITKF